MLQTYQTMASRSRARVEQAIANDDDPLAASLHALLPLNDEALVEWKVWLAYQGMSVGDPELTRIWADPSRTAVDRVARLIAADVETRRIRATITPGTEATGCSPSSRACRSSRSSTPRTGRPKQLRRIVDLELARLRG